MITKDMLQALKGERDRLMSQVGKIDAFLALFTAAAPVQKSNHHAKGKAKAGSASDAARKAWATKKRKAAAAARAQKADGAGASLLEVAS